MFLIYTGDSNHDISNENSQIVFDPQLGPYIPCIYEIKLSITNDFWDNEVR